jgi:hypothetical protein
MMGRLQLSLLAGVLAGGLLSATAAFGDDEEECSRRIAESATVRDIASNPPNFYGHCVRIGGIAGGRYLYDDVHGIYSLQRNRLDPSSTGARLGLDNVSERRELAGDYVNVEIVGRVQDCETVRECVEAAAAAAGPGEIVMIGGYCHYYNGAYLWVKELKSRGPARVQRQLAGSPSYGDLVEAPADWRHAADVRERVESFLTALRTRDSDRLVALHFGGDLEYHRDDVKPLLKFLLRSKRSPFASIRDVPAPQLTILVSRGYPDEDDEPDDSYSAKVCFCRSDDCSGRWPIAELDADNDRSRPYVCTAIDAYGKGREWRLDTTLGEWNGLAEP